MFLSFRTQSGSISLLPPFFTSGFYLLICGSTVAHQPAIVNLSWVSLDLHRWNGGKTGFMPLIWCSLFSLFFIKNTASPNMEQIQTLLKAIQKLLSITTVFDQNPLLNYFSIPWTAPVTRSPIIIFVSILPSKMCVLTSFIPFLFALVPWEHVFCQHTESKCDSALTVGFKCIFLLIS